jgi:hypothetical protein
MQKPVRVTCYQPVSFRCGILCIGICFVEMLGIARLRSTRKFQRCSTLLKYMRCLRLDRCKQRVRVGFRFALQTPLLLTVSDLVGIAMEGRESASQEDPGLDGARSFGWRAGAAPRSAATPVDINADLDYSAARGWASANSSQHRSPSTMRSSYAGGPSGVCQPSGDGYYSSCTHTPLSPCRL